MAIDFPSTSGQATDGSFTHTHNGLTWSWDGTSWIKQESGGGTVDLSNYVKKSDNLSLGVTRTGANSYIKFDGESYFAIDVDAQFAVETGTQIQFESGGQFQVDSGTQIQFASTNSYFEVKSTHATFKDTAGTTSFAKFDSNGLNLYGGGIRDKDGNLGSPGEVLSTTGSQIEWIPNSGGSGSGTSMEHDLWVLTTAPDNDTTMTYSAATIGDGSNRNGTFGRPSTSFYNKNGTGMAESGGTFAFPSEGQWEIKADVVVYSTAPSGAGQDQTHQVWIEHSENGMTGPWTTVSSCKTTETLTSSGTYDVETIHNHFIINVTDTTNELVRFKVTSQSPSTIENAVDKTQFWFKLLESGSVTNTGGGANNFTDLGDTPNSHDAGKWLKSEGGNLIWTTAPLTGITVQNTGVDLATVGTTLNFTGSGVTASGTGSTKTITITDNDTTYSAFTGTNQGLVPDGSSAGSDKFLRSDGSWIIPTDTDTTYSAFTGTNQGLVPSSTSSEQTKYLRSDGTWQVPTNTTYGVFQGVASGLVPASTSGETTKFLRSDGTWQTVSTSSADGNDYVTGASLGTGVDAKKLTLSFADTTLNKTVDLSSIDSDTTYSAFTGTNQGLVPDGTSAGGTKFLRSDGTWQTVTSGGGADGNDYVTNLSLDGTTLKAEFSDSSLDQEVDLASIDTDTTYSAFTGTDQGLVPNGSSAGSTKFLRSDGSWVIPTDTNTTYIVFQGAASGLVPASTSGETTKFLRSDGTWVIPTDTDTTYSAFTGTNQGLVPNGSSAGNDKFLRSDGSWQTVTSGGNDGNDYVTNLSLDGTTLKAEFATSSLDQEVDLASINTDTTYSAFTGTDQGLVPNGSSAGSTKFLRSDGTWVIPTDTDTTYSAFTGTNQGLVPNGSSAGNDKFLRSDGSWVIPTDTDTTYSVFTGGTQGLVPNGSSAGSTKFLRSDGSWVIPTDTDTTYSVFTGGTQGLVPNGSSAGNDKFLRSDGSWADAGGGNPTIRTDNDSDWHYPIFVDSSTDNISQILKLDSGLKYYPGANWLQLTSVQCQKMYDWGNNSYGSSGQFLMSQGASSWKWSTYIHQESNGEIRLSGPTGATTTLEGAHLQFEDMNGSTSYAIDVYRNATSGSGMNPKKVLRFIDQSTGTERFSVGPEGQWGIGHVGGRSFGQLGQVMVSRGPDLSPQWADHGAISGSGIFASSAQGATADTANAEIDHIYSQLNAIGNDDSITTVAQLKTALLALVRN